MYSEHAYNGLARRVAERELDGNLEFIAHKLSAKGLLKMKSPVARSENSGCDCISYANFHVSVRQTSVCLWPGISSRCSCCFQIIVVIAAASTLAVSYLADDRLGCNALYFDDQRLRIRCA